jgi:hypothetical protein
MGVEVGLEADPGQDLGDRPVDQPEPASRVRPIAAVKSST